MKVPVKKYLIAIFSVLCFSCAAATVSIEAQFVEIDATNSAFEGLVTHLLATNPGQPTNGYHRTREGILTRPQFQVVQSALLEVTNGANPLVTARVTTDSRRPAEVEMTDTVTNAENDLLQFRLILAITPVVSTNEYTIEMPFTPTTETSVPNFKHPPRPANWPPVTTLSDVMLPGYVVQDFIGCTIWDGQTIVLEQFPDHVFVDRKRDGRRETLVFSEAKRKQLLVFVTATLIDEHGRPIHSAGEMPMTETTIPPQPALTRPTF